MNALSSNYFICYKSWPLKRHLKEKFMFGFHYAFCVSVLFGMLKTLWEPRLVMAWFLVTHNMIKVIVSIFRTAYSTFSFLCLWPFQIYTASPTPSTCSSTALFCYWMTYLIILTLLINPDSFLSSSLKELLLATFTTSDSLYISYPFTNVYVHIRVHEVDIILWSFWSLLVHQNHLKSVWKCLTSIWLNQSHDCGG